MRAAEGLRCRKCGTCRNVNYLTLECLRCSTNGLIGEEELILEASPHPNLSEYYDPEGKELVYATEVISKDEALERYSVPIGLHTARHWSEGL